MFTSMETQIVGFLMRRLNFMLLQVYAAGCDIVILASDFQRVQIIPGVLHGNVKVSCIDCSTDTGKV